MRFEQWLEFHRKQKPKLMADVRNYMESRYEFSGEPVSGQFMSGGKPIMKGPTARLSSGIESYEQLASLTPAEIRDRDVFPFKPLAHPLQSVAHMVFPPNWLEAHPEHLRIDVDHDFPEAYLPEFPPPMFLTTHKELGDVTNGMEVTLDNFFEIFDGLLTPEQMEGLKELLRAVADHMVQSHRSPHHGGALQGSGLFRLSRQWPHERGHRVGTGRAPQHGATSGGYAHHAR